MFRAAIAISLLLGFAGCTDECNELSWTEGLLLVIHRPDFAPLPNGLYQIEIDDAHAAAMTVEVLYFDGEPYCRAADQCTDVAAFDGSDQTDLVGTIIGVNPDSLELQLVYRSADGLHGGPDEVALSVSHEGVEIGGAVLTPDYASDELNGEGCGFATRASDQLVMTLAE